MHAAPVQTSDNYVGQIRSLLEYEPRTIEVSLDNSDGTLDYEEIRRITAKARASGLIGKRPEYKEEHDWKIKRYMLNSEQKEKLFKSFNKLIKHYGLTRRTAAAICGITGGSIGSCENISTDRMIGLFESIINHITEGQDND